MDENLKAVRGTLLCAPCNEKRGKKCENLKAVQGTLLCVAVCTGV